MHPSVSLVANAIKVSLPRLGVVLERLLAIVTEVTLRHCNRVTVSCPDRGESLGTRPVWTQDIGL